MTARSIIVSSEPATPTWATSYPPSISHADLLARPKPDWLVEHWCMRQAVTLLTGRSESFKTFLAMDLAVKLAHPGSPTFGPHLIDRSTAPPGGGFKVRYIIGESSGAAAHRFEGVRQNMGLSLADFPEGLRYRDDVLDIFAKTDDVEAWIELEDPDVIIFDTYSAMTRGMDENSKAAVDVVLGMAQRVKKRGAGGLGRSVIFLVHPAKNDDSLFRGHSSLLNDTDIVIESDRVDTRKGQTRLTVTPFYSEIISKRQKEHDDFIPYYIRMDTHVVLDAAGKPIISPFGKETSTLVIGSTTDTPPDVTARIAVGSPATTGPAPSKQVEVLEYLTDHPGATDTEILLAIWPAAKPGDSHARNKLNELAKKDKVEKVDGKWYVIAPPPLDELPAL